MGTTSLPLTGPDFALGISESDIRNGGMVLGQLDGEAVLLYRRAQNFYAVGARCTHYGAPLYDGAVFGDELRCPWHHAVFSLKTGAALSAPALNPLPCWEVERRSGKIFVRSKKTQTPKCPVATAVKSIVIIGGGAAGNAAAEALRNEGFAGSVTMVGNESSVPYDRPNLSKDFLAGKAQEEWIPLRSPEFYKESRIDLQLSRTVTALDTEHRKVTLDDGKIISFDACLLATGARPIRLEITGAQLPHVVYLRSLADCNELISKISTAKRAVIVGSGFIGLEAAAAFRARGLAVDVVTMDASPLLRVVGAEVSDLVQKTHEAQGVRFHFNHSLSSIRESEVELDDGSVIQAEVVLVAIGVRPDTALAESAGLHVNHGVLVNEFLETSASGIYAAGDIARWSEASGNRTLRVEHWVVAERQGQIAAANMLGQQTPFRSVPFFWTSQYDLTLAYVGHAEKVEQTVVVGDLAEREAMVGYIENGKIAAALTVGMDKESLAIEDALARGDQRALRKMFRI